jgi:serine/threonine-protein kinase RsbT
VEPLSSSGNGVADLIRVSDVAVASRDDVPAVARATRDCARVAGFGIEDAECVILAATELATNLAKYAAGGNIHISLMDDGARTVLQLESSDTGPGIPDTEQAMQDGFSTGGGLGAGLPGIRRLMDQFEITTSSDGTRVVARKWSSGR